MTITIAHTPPKTKRPKKKVGIFHWIEPDEGPFIFTAPWSSFATTPLLLCSTGLLG
jgi:hypothetical protein